MWQISNMSFCRFDSQNPMFSYQSDGSASNALIMPTGSIIFVPETGREFICSNVNFDDFWGEQECFFKFGSWTYDGYLLNIIPYDGKTELDLDEYDKSSPLLVSCKQNILPRQIT